MQWYKITISTTIDAQDLMSAMLYDLGISGVELINNESITEEEKKAMFIDILPEVDEEDKMAQLIFYIEKGQNLQCTLRDVKQGIDDLRGKVDVGSGDVDVTVTKDEDWANNWKEHFKAFKVADDIIIKPTWVTLDNNKVNHNDLIVEIDPEMAFGTGAHETTKLAIKGIREYLNPGQKVLDLGCGSGILSIISKKLGASNIVGTDIDANAVKTARKNVRVNEVSPEDVSFLIGNVLDLEEAKEKELDKKIGLMKYDIVVANILTEVILDLAKIVGKYMKKGGYFISSGILYTQSDKVEAEIKSNGFEIIEVNQMNDWVSIVARKDT